MSYVGLIAGISAAYASYAEQQHRLHESVPTDAEVLLRKPAVYKRGTSFVVSTVRCAYCRRERFTALRTHRCEGCGATETL